MFTPPKIILLSAILAMVPACSSELSEEEQEILNTRLAEEHKPTNRIAVMQANPDLTTMSMLIGLSGLAAELPEQGPYTGFVATNEAFNKLDAERLRSLLSADNKDELLSIAKFNTLKGDMTAADIAKAVADGGGTASLETMQGGSINATMEGETIVLEDGAGNKARITEADVKSSEGTLHVIDTVMMPE
jgi:uncharacterized surface protein with fasciclin (FAS1) repeats